MSWEMDEKEEMDVPNLPFKKPKAFEHLEKLSPAQRDAMDGVELEEHIRAACLELVQKYRKDIKGDQEGCNLIIKAALSEFGNSLGGKAGAAIVGMGDRMARLACEMIYSNKNTNFQN